jgi:hypothetical protein
MVRDTQMAALRGDISFRYLKQFFLVDFWIVSKLVFLFLFFNLSLGNEGQSYYNQKSKKTNDSPGNISNCRTQIWSFHY